MQVWTCTNHENFWPVGAASVVVAENEAQAREILTAALHKRGLGQQMPEDLELKPLNTTDAHAVVLWDGNY